VSCIGWLKEIEAEIKRWHQNNEASCRLGTIPAILKHLLSRKL